jgi:hypothetical protein
MVFQRCSDVADLSGGAAILDAESRRSAASTSDSEYPGALALSARELLTTTRCNEPLFI